MVDSAMKTELEEAATAYEQAPKRLKAAILSAAAAGERPADITRTIRHVYTADYVARLVREAKKAESPNADPSPDSSGS